jgi:hypothetical protein
MELLPGPEDVVSVALLIQIGAAAFNACSMGCRMVRNRGARESVPYAIGALFPSGSRASAFSLPRGISDIYALSTDQENGPDGAIDTTMRQMPMSITRPR